MLNDLGMMRTWYSPDLSKHDQLLTLLETYHKIPMSDIKDYGDTLTWCLENCQGKFRDLKHGEGLIWYFEQEQDAALFALRWA